MLVEKINDIFRFYKNEKRVGNLIIKHVDHKFTSDLIPVLLNRQNQFEIKLISAGSILEKCK